MPDVQREQNESLPSVWVLSSPLKTFTSKTTSPTGYTVCENKKNQCPFFTKTSLLEDYCTMLLYHVKQIYQDLPPFCKQDKTATLSLSKTKVNFNRPFFMCGNNIEHDPCSYFQWADQDPNKFTLALNHPRSLYFSQNPPPPSPEAKLKKKKRCLDPLKATSIILPVPKRTHQFKKEPKEPKNKKSTARDNHHHCLARRQYPRPWYTVYTPRTLKH